MKSNIIAVLRLGGLYLQPKTNFIAFAAAYPQYDKKTGTSKLGGYEVSYYELKQAKSGQSFVNKHHFCPYTSKRH